MASKIFRHSPGTPEKAAGFLRDSLSECISTLNEGGIIVFPTETLYGLGVDIKNDAAIERIIKLKARPNSIPIAIAVSSLEQAEQLAELSELAIKIINDCLPKPVTLLSRAKKTVSPKLTAGSDLIGLRFPNNTVTVELLNHFGPISATSANIHGGAEPVTIEPVQEQFGEQIEIYIDTGPCLFGRPSTVVDTTSDTIKIIRDGACSGDELNKCIRSI